MGEIVFYILGALFFAALYGVWVWCLVDLVKNDYWILAALGLLVPILAPIFAIIFAGDGKRDSSYTLLLYLMAGLVIYVIMLILRNQNLFTASEIIIPALLAAVCAGCFVALGDRQNSKSS